MFGLSATRPIRPVSVPELTNAISQRSKVRLYEVKTVLIIRAYVLASKGLQGG